MAKFTSGLKQRIIDLLSDGSKVIGLKLCFRNIDTSLELPALWWQHMVDACLIHKNRDEETATCRRFAGEQTNRDLSEHPRGMIRRCPFGHTDILTPVLVNGIYAGPLFAGACWVDGGTPPHPSLVVPPDENWLRERLSILNCIATELGHMLQAGVAEKPLKRRQQIIGYIQDTLHSNVSLDDLAKRLNLSPSRTTHLVREIFGTSLPLLSRQHKLLRAAGDLVDTDLPVGEIAHRYGFLDQNYFSRIFSEHFNTSPSRYRKTHDNPA